MLGWPKSSFGFFHNIFWKNLSELFGQPNIWTFFIHVNEIYDQLYQSLPKDFIDSYNCQRKRRFWKSCQMISPFYRWKNRNLKELSDFLKFIQQVQWRPKVLLSLVQFSFRSPILLVFSSFSSIYLLYQELTLM